MGVTMADVRPTEKPTVEFERELVALIPQIRAFARTFAGHKADGDDLAQETLSRAWSSWTSFRRGSNMKAWAFVILRNIYFSERRRSWRRSSLDPDLLARSLVAPDNPDSTLALDDLRRGLGQLPDEQREALILVAAGGLSYEEAARVCEVELGTIKSRVSRARRTLEHLIDSGAVEKDRVSATDAFALIFREAMAAASRQAASA